jgi:hypothetical protein
MIDYTALAQNLFGCEAAEVTPEERQRAKRWFYEQVYIPTKARGNNPDLVILDELDPNE